MNSVPSRGIVALGIAALIGFWAVAAAPLHAANKHRTAPAGFVKDSDAPRASLGTSASPDDKTAAESPKALPPGEWAISIEPEGQLFSSLLIASATLKPLDPAGAPSPDVPADKKLAARAGKPRQPDPAAPIILGDGNGVVQIHLHSPASLAAPARLRIAVKENTYMEAGLFDAELTEPDREYTLQPKIAYKYEALARVHQARPVDIAICMTLDGRDLGEKLATAQVHTINDCIYGYRGAPDGQDFQDFAWMFAAYVNEDHPLVRTLLKDAQAAHIADGFDGYQSADPSQVLLQLFAFWKVLQDKAIAYSDIGTTSSESDNVWNMHVRFPDESLADGQANCVDASVLLASVLRKVGLKPFLVLAPGHMYLGLYLDAEGKTSACLETTLLGTGPTRVGSFHPNRRLAKAASSAVKGLPSWKTFNAALDCATSDFRKNKRKYEREDDPEYQLIDIEAARREGILPIPSSIAD